MQRSNGAWCKKSVSDSQCLPTAFRRIKKFLLSTRISLIYCCFATNSLLAQVPLPSLAPVLAKTMPSIVNISVQGVVETNDIEDKEQDKQPQPAKPKKFEGMGSGVVINAKKGYIITNAHVIKNANIIDITTHDGRRLSAKVIGADNDTDVAVLQVNYQGLSELAMGNSSHMKVGDFVVAIGNPYGLNSFGSNQSASFGIISAVGRNNLNLEGVEDFIQTDAAINPGSSGGALVSTNGELIGINTAILTPFGGNVGIGFAIPINMVKIVTDQLINYGTVNRGLMGVFVQPLTPEMASMFGVPPQTHGALVTQVNSHSSAERAGLKTGDIITQINDTSITDSAQVKTFIGLTRVGSTINVRVIRDKKALVLTGTVSSLEQQESLLQRSNPHLNGLALATFSQTNPFQGHVEGVQVVGASEQSNAYRVGIRPGDVIDKAAMKPVKTVDDLMKVSSQTREVLLLHVLRGMGALYVVVPPK